MRINANQTLILGPPGCGKTTRSLSLVNDALERGIEPDRIAFVSFTRKAIFEATERACAAFTLGNRDLPYFRTVHSMCFRALRVTKQDMMDKDAYKELGDILGYRFEGTFDESETGLPVGDEKGDQLLFLDNYARITCKSLRETWENADSGLDWLEVERMGTALAQFKHARCLMDYTDLLTRFVKNGKSLPVKLAIVDEAQDLSILQWQVLATAFKDCEQVYIAGDDDQSIYRWSGADTETFLSLEGERETLKKSYRLPKLVYNKALKIISDVPHRFAKPFSPRDSDGMVDALPNLDYAVINNDETTMILVRNVFLLSRVQKLLMGQGHPFVGRHGYSSIKHDHVDAIDCWEGLQKGKRTPIKRIQNMYEHMHIGTYLARGAKSKMALASKDLHLTQADLMKDYGLLRYAIWHEALEGMDLAMRAYYLSILHSGRKITETPKITIQTIHGVKGGEADHVILLPDMSRRTYDEYLKSPIDEHRVAYVAVTRAKEKLSIVSPSSQRAYNY